MILADTSVWVDHLRSGDLRLAALLEAGKVLAHPFVLGELALGGARPDGPAMTSLRELPQAARADDEEVLGFILARGLAGRGVGWVDASLLAATVLTPDARLWTRDRRLAEVAVELGVGADDTA